MHPANRLLSHLGLRVSRAPSARIPGEFIRQYEDGYKSMQHNRRGFGVFRQMMYDAGEHPSSYIDFECAFAASTIAARHPASILDIGSYRHFVLGLLGHSRVTTLDVRSRQPATANETVLTSDAKAIDGPSGQFDLVVSLCAIEHFGLGRYGDELDVDADQKALREMARVLRPGGALVLSTTITRARPTIAFNAHRIFDYAMISAMRGTMRLEREAFFSNSRADVVPLSDINETEGVWDVYCACWIKDSESSTAGIV